MKRFGIVLRIVLAVVLAQLGWTWLQRHDANLRIRRVLEGRNAPAKALPPDDGAVKIVQFYARAAEMSPSVGRELSRPEPPATPTTWPRARIARPLRN